MQKVDSSFKIINPPDINSMYVFLFYSFRAWYEAHQQFSANFEKDKSEKTPVLLSASRYSTILGSYGLLDAIIHTYVVMNNYRTSDNEDDKSVYAKWKNFPFVVEKTAFKKKDILIIDKIRLLRNDIAHPKAELRTPEEKQLGPVSMVISEPSSGDVEGYINFKPQFTISNGIFLLNETTRLIELAETTLSNVSFLPKKKFQFGSSGVMWPDNVDVL